MSPSLKMPSLLYKQSGSQGDSLRSSCLISQGMGSPSFEEAHVRVLVAPYCLPSRLGVKLPHYEWRLGGGRGPVISQPFFLGIVPAAWS